MTKVDSTGNVVYAFIMLVITSFSMIPGFKWGVDYEGQGKRTNQISL